MDMTCKLLKITYCLNLHLPDPVRISQAIEVGRGGSGSKRKNSLSFMEIHISDEAGGKNMDADKIVQEEGRKRKG